jgi:4-hydroxy-2-oxoheptanedioate aldolase
MSRLTDWTPQSALGVWSLLGPAAAETVSHGKPGWIGLDGQHGLYDDRAVRDALHAITTVDVLVRVPSNDAAAIGRALDAGARGVIVPLVETADDAAMAAAAVRYPAAGARSWGPFAEYWGRDEVAADEANTQAVCGVMVETRRGLDQVDEIAGTPGVDLIFVGPYDLALSLRTSLDELIDANHGELEAIVSACRTNDVIPGAYAGTSARAARLAELGFELIAATTDRKLLLDGTAALGSPTAPASAYPRG